MNEHTTIDQSALDLINGGVDAELSVAEQEDLDRLLAGSSEAREINEELKSFVQLMEGLPEIEPQQYLQESIERQIRLPVQNKVPGDKQGFIGTWLSANWLRTGFALAAGVVLTVAVYEMGSKPISEKDATNLVGTVVKSQAPDQGALVDRIQITNDSLDGLVELRERDDLFTLDVQLNSDGPTEVVVSFAGRGLDFEGITRGQDHNVAVSVVDGSIYVASSGEHRYTLNLRRNTDPLGQHTAPLELEFFANNELVYETELSVSRQ